MDQTSRGDAVGVPGVTMALSMDDGITDVSPDSALTDHAVRAADAAWAQVDRVVRASGTSFFWAMRFLPKHKRRAMFAVYAFCREVDDIADEPAPLAQKRQQLSQWRVEIEGVATCQPVANPIAQALAEVFEPFGFDKADLIAVIDGMEMDAQETIALETWEDVMLYCDRVACAVGRLCCCIFGLDKKTGRALAENLGLALQLTNILRDVGEDAERARVYLPQAWLREAGVHTDTPQSVLEDPHLPKVLEEIAGRADAYFEQAAVILNGCNRSHVKPAIMMREVYVRVFRRLQARGWHRLSHRVSLSKPHKMLIAIRYGVF